MPTTLVTGGTGFVGSSIVNELLAQNHTLILAVRTASSANALLASNPSWPKDSITTFPIPDFTKPRAFDAVFKEHPEIEYILHVAAPMLDHPDNTNFEEHFEKPSILGNLGLLKSAKEHGKNVKAISVTGSMNAITTGSQEDIKAREFNDKEWLPLDREDAIKANNNYVSSQPFATQVAFPSMLSSYLPTSSNLLNCRSPTASARNSPNKQSGSSSRTKSPLSTWQTSCPR